MKKFVTFVSALLVILTLVFACSPTEVIVEKEIIVEKEVLVPQEVLVNAPTVITIRFLDFENGAVDVTTPDGNYTASTAADIYEVEPGAEVTLTASPDSDYVFSSWDLPNFLLTKTVAMAGNSTITFTVGNESADYSFKPNFINETITNSVAINFFGFSNGSVAFSNSSGPDDVIDAAASHNVYAESVITLAATPAEGYAFVGWVNIPAYLADMADNSTITFITKNNISYLFKPNFVPIVSITSNEFSGGSVEVITSTDTYTYTATSGTTTFDVLLDSSVTLTANPATDYYFLKWDLATALTNDKKAKSITFTVDDGNATYFFEPQFVHTSDIVNFNVTFSLNGSPVSIGHSYPAGDEIEADKFWNGTNVQVQLSETDLSAAGYTVEKWIINGADYPGNASQQGYFDNASKTWISLAFKNDATTGAQYVDFSGPIADVTTELNIEIILASN